jgi:hypothetical protein
MFELLQEVTDPLQGLTSPGSVALIYRLGASYIGQHNPGDGEFVLECSYHVPDWHRATYPRALMLDRTLRV